MQVNDVLGEKYILLEFLKSGGMGEVWIAEDKELKRRVAIKAASAELSPSSFRDEAKNGAKLLGHPNIVALLDYGYETVNNNESIQYIVMEYVKGITLNEFIQSIKSEVDYKTYYYISLLIAWELCKAVGFAHKNDVIHRDIKPLNIFLSGHGFSKLGDFGLSKIVDQATRSHTVKKYWSDVYAAPEQWEQGTHSKQTDIYQLGGTLYHLFTGREPFEDYKGFSLLNAHLKEQVKNPNFFESELSNELSEIIIKMLSKDAKDRPELWEINDVIAKELKGNYELTVYVKNEDKELKEKIHMITDFEFEEDNLVTGSSTSLFIDFTEVLSEGIQLIVSNINHFVIRKQS